ncbi:MAG: tetratricopeptide repeat protein [Elusimicrobia bacterium]|nr:tetratricopeptide repeat protein [Elusimicrobiota bacterium]
MKRTLDRLGHAEVLEGLSRRWSLPFCPEYELFYFQRLHQESLLAALSELKGASGAEPAAWRGRVRRLLGDVVGARADLEAAARAGSGLGLLWLGELDLGLASAEERLRAAAARLPESPWPALYLGASRLLRGRPDAAAALEEFTRRRPGSCLGQMLCGVARERKGCVGPAIESFARAAKADATCAAPHLLRARALQDDAAAARACEDAFDADPEYAHIAMCLHRKGSDWPGELRKLVRFAFGARRFLSLSARFLENDKKILPGHFEGVRWAEEFLRRHPDRSWSWGLLGRAYARCPPSSGLPSRSLAAFDRAVRLAPHQGWPLGWRGVARIGAGRRQEALADLNAGLKRQPYYFWAYEWRGGLLQSLGRNREALRDLDRAVAMNPHYPFSLNRRSAARRALGDHAGAVLDLDEAFRLDARYAWVFSTGRAPAEAELKAAVAELTRVLRGRPSIASLWTWRGQTQLQRRDFSAAFRDFERAIALDPAHALSRAWYGRALSEAGRFEAACRQLRRAVELAGDRRQYRIWLAAALRAGGDARGALALLGRLLRENPRCAQAWQERSLAALAGGRGREALRCARRAAALDGRNADAHCLTAQALLRLDRARAAEKEIELVLAISPHHGRARLLRAEIRLRLGRQDEAIDDYRRALNESPFLFNDEQRRRVESLVRAS